MNRQKFQKSLNKLVGWRESAFMLALAERALPNALLYFDSITEGSDRVMVLRGLESNQARSWDHLVLNPEEDKLVMLLDETVALFPEDSNRYGALPATDYLWLLEQALLSGINREIRRALASSERSLTTVMQFIEFSEGDDLDENELIKRFDAHPLIEREFSFQQELAEILRAAKKPSAKLLEDIQTLARDEGVSNIGISLAEE